MSVYGREMLQFIFTVVAVIAIALYLSKKEDE